jgi:hypothetical protein
MDFNEQDIQEGERQLDVMMAAAQRKQARQQAQQAQIELANSEMEALKELGVTPEQFQQICAQNHSKAVDVMKGERKKAVAKFLRKVTAQSQPQGQELQGRPEKPTPKGKLSMQEIAAQRQAGKLDSDRALGKMVEAVLSDYFKQTMGGQG